ncbi:MAG: hypothetical protein AAF707_00075 [Pseudomonadota bacterium]
MAETAPEPSMHGDEPLLEISTLITRPVIAIDGVKYQILSADELSVIEAVRFGRWGAKIKQLSESDEVEAEEEVDALIERASRTILVGVTDDVFERLSGQNKWAVVDFFSALLLRRATGVAEAMNRAAGVEDPIGASQSPSSSGSSAETQRRGCIERLKSWFGLT